MTRSRLAAFAVIAIVAALLIWAPSGKLASQAFDQVFVTNFPNPQTVEGAVDVRGPILQSRMVAYRQLTVPPVDPSDTTRLVDGGRLVSDGFPAVVLSLHGEVKGSVQKPGSVGAMLVPEEPAIQDAFNQVGLVHFALRVTAPHVSPGTPFFASDQPRYTIGFQQYRVLLFNTTDKTVTVDLFAYLTD